MSESAPWDATLQALLAGRIITGYTLISHTGACLASCGTLSDELRIAEEPSPAAQQIVSLFNTTATRDHLDICGQQAIIFQRSDSSVYAVSRGKQLGVTAHFLPSGILVTTFGMPNLPQTVVPQVEAACDKLRHA